MKLSIKKHLTVYTFIALLVGVFLGTTLIFSYEKIRYTKYVPPRTVESSPSLAYEYMQNHPNGYLFLDVRSKGEYAQLHALNSISVPIANLFEMWKILPRSSDKKIYLICTSGRLASIAYGYLQLHGFTNIVHVEGGLQSWKDKGLPVNVGTNKVDPNFSLDIPVNVGATSSLNK